MLASVYAWYQRMRCCLKPGVIDGPCKINESNFKPGDSSAIICVVFETEQSQYCSLSQYGAGCMLETNKRTGHSPRMAGAGHRNTVTSMTAHRVWETSDHTEC